MAIHVNIGEAKPRLSELVEAALRGEQVVLQRRNWPSCPCFTGIPQTGC